MAINPNRIRTLKQGDIGPGAVVYWMSREQRVHDNWALLAAQQKALELKRPLVVLFCLTGNFLGAVRRHYSFLVEGLMDLPFELKKYNLSFCLLIGDPSETLPAFLAEERSALLVTDFDPLTIKRKWKEKLASRITCTMLEADAHNIVPCWFASDKREYAAYTFRPKMKRLLTEYLTDFPALVKHPYGTAQDNFAEINIDAFLQQIPARGVSGVSWLHSGEKAARKSLQIFLNEGLVKYDQDRNNPCKNGQSNLSPYFHYGHLSPQRVAWQVKNCKIESELTEGFLEELIIRRELADNFCFYCPSYDSFAAFPDWAKASLNEHRKDTRDYLYSNQQFEQAETHDQLWNACQVDLAAKGKLHGYLRMYWAKKILEWTVSPEEAQAVAIFLNDKYSLDGRDPCGYSGIAWSIGGVHDRAWKSRPVFGKIRYMNSKGCRRKFDVDGFIKKVHKSV